MSQIPEATRCARHPSVETVLRCSRCETPICPNCLVQTPVGARCRDCAGLKRLPTYQAGTGTLVRSVLAAMGTAIVGAVIIDMIRGFAIILTILLGIVIAEAVGLATNRRRGPYFAWAALIGTVLGMVLGRGVLVFFVLGNLPTDLRLRAALAAMGSIDFMSWLIILGAAAIAYYRLRL